MITFTIEPDAGSKIAAHLERVRVQIISALRGGMYQAMGELAEYVVGSKLSGSPVGRRAGDLAAAVLASVRVRANDEQVYGSVAAKPKKLPNEGLWQEFGTKHPPVLDKLRMFAAPGGGLVFTRRTREFATEPRPFLNPSLQEQKTQIMETIRGRLREAQLQ